MLLNRNNWLYATALAAVALLSQADALESAKLREDYEHAATPKPLSFSAIVSPTGQTTLFTDGELAAIAASAMAEIQALPNSGDISVMSVLQDAETLEVYIASSTRRNRMGMYPADNYLVNERLLSLNPPHRVGGMCAECNVLKLYEDKWLFEEQRLAADPVLWANMRHNGRAPPANSKIVAWGKASQSVWSPCGASGGSGCRDLIDLYPGLRAIRSGAVPSMVPESKWQPFTKLNPRHGQNVVCQRQEPSANATSCALTKLTGDPVEDDAFTTANSTTPNGSANNTMTSVESLTSSMASLSTPSTAKSTTATGTSSRTASRTGSLIGTAPHTRSTATRSSLIGTAPLTRSTATRSSASGSSRTATGSLTRTSATHSSVVRSSSTTPAAGKPTTLVTRTSTSARAPVTTRTPVVGKPTTTKAVVKPTKKPGKIARGDVAEEA